jgi:hypothetical protein
VLGDLQEQLTGSHERRQVVVELLARGPPKAVASVEGCGQGSQVIIVRLDYGRHGLKDVTSIGQVLQGRGREQDTFLLHADVADKEDR